MTEIIKTDSRYLHGEDLFVNGEPVRVTMTVKDVGDKNTAKSEDGRVIEGWPVTFEERPKVLVLNETNRKLATAAMGTNVRSEWKGKPLTFWPYVGNWLGQKNVLAVRIVLKPKTRHAFIKPQDWGNPVPGKGAPTHD